MQAQPAGAMLSVRAGFDAIAQRLPEALSMAAENAPGSCVVAGPFDAIEAFQAQLEADGIACRALRTSHAFHSAMMRSEEHTSELQSLMRISYAVFCLKKKNKKHNEI